MCEINPREVLKHLNELGYFDVNRQQLKQFIKDLKTLIRYDIKKILEKEIIEPVETQINLTNHHRKSGKNHKYECEVEQFARQLNKPNNNEQLTRVFDSLHSTSTVSSRAKSIPKKSNYHPSRNIQKTNKPQTREQTVTHYRNKVQQKNYKNNNFKSDTESETEVITEINLKSVSSLQRSKKEEYSVQDSERFNDIRENKVESYKKKVQLKPVRSEIVRPTVSFIRPRKPVKSTKSDPVALYQHYQEEWKRQKIPGEDKRFNLRWSIREKMLGEPESCPY